MWLVKYIIAVMSTQVVNPEIAPVLAKPMARKYDGRGKANRERARKTSGRKPKWAKHLSRNSAAEILSQADFKAKALELLNAPDLRLRFEVIRYLWDRFEGRPFVAENPNVTKPNNPILQDQRLQIAVQQLNIMQPKSKKRRILHSPPDVDPKALSGQVIPQTKGDSVSVNTQDNVDDHSQEHA